MSESSFVVPALVVARRQKRLHYWRNYLSSSSTATEKTGEKLEVYGQLIARLAKADSQQAADEAERRLQALERELVSAFEDRRLMTSTSGISAISD